jgi:uncharacterized RDD family membrane protein YckC
MRDDWDDELDILSAENVNFALETAGLGSRFGAAVIDLTLQAIAITLLLVVVTVNGNYLALWEDLGKWMRAIVGALVILVVFTITYGYYFFFEWLWDGQTPGKRWLGLRVLQTSGMPLTAWSALTRNLLRTVDFLPALYGVGVVVSLINPHNRRIGDLVAGTVVTREQHDATRHILDIDAAADAFLAAYATTANSSAQRPDATSTTLPGTTATLPPAGQPEMAAVANAPGTSVPGTASDTNEAAWLWNLDDQDRELVHEFMVRRTRLQAAARSRLAFSLAARLCAKIGQPAPAAADSEPFLEAIAHTLQRTPSGAGK